MQVYKTTKNSGDNSEGDDDDISTTTNWLLEQTIRCHEERVRNNGVICCELWLGNGDGKDIGGRKPELLSHWQRNTRAKAAATTTISGNDALLQNPQPRRHDNKDNVSNSMLGEQLANHLWNHHKNSSDRKVLWHRVSSLNDSIDGSQAVPKQQPQQSQQQQIRKHSPDNETDLSIPIDWVASISFDIPFGASDTSPKNAGDSTDSNSSNLQGMLCWLFEPTTKSKNYPSIRPTIECYLRSATHHIAITYALESSFQLLTWPERKPLPLSSESNPTDTVPKVKHSNLVGSHSNTNSYYRNDIDLDKTIEREIAAKSALAIQDARKITNGSDDTDKNDLTTRMFLFFKTYFGKFKGQGKLGPMPLCLKQTMFAFIGSFITIYLIHWFNVLMTSVTRRNNWSYTELSEIDMSTASGIEIVRAWCDDYSSDAKWEALEMGPFGATCVIVFTLTSSPPAQPRSLLFGTIIGMVVGKLIGYLGMVGVDVGVRMALATALTGSIMAQTCTMYPPAAALAIIFSSQLLGWNRFGLQLFGIILIIFLGVVLNNLHPLRTYPTFWLGCEEGCGKKKDPDADTKRLRHACQLNP